MKTRQNTPNICCSEIFCRLILVYIEQKFNNKTGNVRTKVKLRRFRANIFAARKQEVLHTLSVSVALVIQHAKRLRYILSSLASLALPYFPTLSQKRHDFRKIFNEHKMRFFKFSLQRLCEALLILRRIQRDVVIKVTTSLCKVPVILDVF